jgi:hypothetical protein
MSGMRLPSGLGLGAEHVNRERPGFFCLAAIHLHVLVLGAPPLVGRRLAAVYG